MSMKDKSIRIDDWTGKQLYIGPYDDKEVDTILQANRCTASYCDSGTRGIPNTDNNGTNTIDIECTHCDGTGYSGDFEVSWIDSDNDANDMNVYEYINY